MPQSFLAIRRLADLLISCLLAHTRWQLVCLSFLTEHTVMCVLVNVDELPHSLQARVFTDLENHRFDSSYEESLVYKVAPMFWLNDSFMFRFATVLFFYFIIIFLFARNHRVLLFVQFLAISS